MKFKKYLESYIGTTGELRADGVTYIFTTRPGQEIKNPATIAGVEEDFIVLDVAFRKVRAHRVIPFSAFSLCVSEE